MLRIVLASMLAIGLVAPAHADPKAALHDSFTKFLALKSFRGTIHGTMSGKTNVSTVEYMAPDSYRVTAGGRPPSLIVNGTMYINVNGQSMKIPMGKDLIAQYRNTAVLAEIEKSVTIEDLGADVVDGQPAHKYRYTITQPHPSTSVMWISNKNGLPIQVQTSGKAMGKTVDTTIKYDKFNDPSIQIVAPK